MSNLKLKITLILSFFVLNSCQKKTKTEDLNNFIYLESTIESLINSSEMTYFASLQDIAVVYPQGLNFFGLSLFEYLETSFSLTFFKISLI